MLSWLRRKRGATPGNLGAPMTQDPFQGVPIAKPSAFKKEAADSQKRVLSFVPGAVVDSTTIVFSVYPRTQPNAPVYSSTGDAFCLIRFDVSDEQYRYFATALRDAKVWLTIKTYSYPSYPIIQFVIRIYPTGRKDPWWQETMGNITDGDIRDFITDTCGNRKWKLIMARYNPYQEKALNQMIDPHEKEVIVSEQEAKRFYQEAKSAAQDYLRIPGSQRDFMQAAKRLTADNPPIEGVQ